MHDVLVYEEQTSKQAASQPLTQNEQQQQHEQQLQTLQQ